MSHLNVLVARTRGLSVVATQWRSMAIMLLLLSCALVVPAFVAPAHAAEQDDPPIDGLALLTRIQDAARTLDYTGVFMYTQGGFTQSSRITHRVDGTGSRERLEVLDGEPREFIRHNDDVQCLMPERKKVLLERRRTDRFPGVLLGDPAGLDANYDISVRPGTHRLAGYSCQIIDIKPRDAARYGYKLCADTDTNLLIKAQTLDSESNIIEQVMFTSLTIGGEIAADALQPSWSTRGWQVVESAMTPVDLVSRGWRVPPPPGFVPMMQVERVLGKTDPVGQVVFSDGMAAISVFIEPYGARGTLHKKQGAARHGAINVFGTRIADFWLTALGEVPMATLQELAESTEYVPLPK